MQITINRTTNTQFFLASLLALIAILLLISSPANAVPSFSRQTGQSVTFVIPSPLALI